MPPSDSFIQYFSFFVIVGFLVWFLSSLYFYYLKQILNLSTYWIYSHPQSSKILPLSQHTQLCYFTKKKKPNTTTAIKPKKPHKIKSTFSENSSTSLIVLNHVKRSKVLYWFSLHVTWLRLNKYNWEIFTLLSS